MVNASLIFLRSAGGCLALVDGDPFGGTVRGGDCSAELLLEVALGVVVLGEDDDAQGVPSGWRARRLSPSPGEAGRGTSLAGSSRPGSGPERRGGRARPRRPRSFRRAVVFRARRRRAWRRPLSRVAASIWASSSARRSSSGRAARSSSLSTPSAKRSSSVSELGLSGGSCPALACCFSTVRRWTPGCGRRLRRRRADAAGGLRSAGRRSPACVWFRP